MTGEVGWAMITHKVKVAHQPLHSSVRVNWEFSSNLGFILQWLQKSSFILISIGCNCNTEGSIGIGCDNTDGKCTCKPNIYDKICEQCAEGYFGFPNCQSKFQLSTFPKYILICYILQYKNLLSF